MIAFVVMVLDELADPAAQGALAEEDRALEAEFFDSAYARFRKGV